MNSETAPEPFCPSNSSEGLDFMDGWCKRCRADSPDDPCDILTSAMATGSAPQWQYRDGEAVCTEFQSMESLS